MILPESEIQFIASSVVDPIGRLFTWEGDLYRGICPECEEGIRSLLSSDCIQKLMTQRWIQPTEITHYSTKEYPLILKHQWIPFPTYPYEWSDAMFRDVALFALELNANLVKHGFLLRDGHCWNYLIEQTKPMLVDLGSIAVLPQESAARRLFYFYRSYTLWFLRRMKLISLGQGRVARACLSYSLKVQLADLPKSRISALLRLPGSLIKNTFKRLCSTNRQSNSPHAIESPSLQQLAVRPSAPKNLILVFWAILHFVLRTRVLLLSRIQRRSYWQNYYASSRFTTAQFKQKETAVKEILSSIPIGSVLDIGCNLGRFSRIAASIGHTVMATDSDPVCIDTFYQSVKNKKVRNISLALASFYRIDTTSSSLLVSFKAPTERWRADTVLALAVMHHLLKRGIFEYPPLFEIFAKICKRQLIFEHVPRFEGDKAQEDKDCMIIAAANAGFHLQKDWKSESDRVIYQFGRRSEEKEIACESFIFAQNI